jgi:hypothetical protein
MKGVVIVVGMALINVSALISFSLSVQYDARKKKLDGVHILFGDDISCPM